MMGDVQTFPPAAAAPGRHPLDPEPVGSSKAPAVLALGIIAVLTGPFVGGAVPATIALLLARQARREAWASAGFLTGAARIRQGERLAWFALALALTTLVVAGIAGLLDWAGTPVGTDFDSDVD